MSCIGKSAEQDERETDRDEDRRRVDRIAELVRRGPANGARAEEERAAVAFQPRWTAVPDEEPGNDQEAAGEVEADRERPRERRADEQPDYDGHERGQGGDHACDPREAEERRAEEGQPATACRPGRRNSSSVSGQRSSG